MKKFAEYFKPNKKKDAVKSETSFGKQAQFDWKEKLKFSFKSGEEFIFNVGSLILSASRFKYWAICPSTSQAYLFDFLTNVFEALGGVPKEIVIDNASTMMDKARTERSDGKVNPKFQQFADDFGFNIVPCIRARPNTKAKVENPMRVINEIMTYNGLLNNEEELFEKMQEITNEANSRVCQAIGIPPILVFKKRKNIFYHYQMIKYVLITKIQQYMRKSIPMDYFAIREIYILSPLILLIKILLLKLLIITYMFIMTIN